MAGRNGDIAEGNEHDHPVDVPDRQVGTQLTVSPGNGHPPSNAPTAEQVTDAWKWSHRGETCRACRVGTERANSSAKKRKVGKIRGSSSTSDSANLEELAWYDGRSAAENYEALGECLAQAGDLFRNPAGGLLLKLPDGSHRHITRGLELAAIIVDRVPGRIIRLRNGKGDIIPAAHLNAMVQSNKFLGKFRPADQITRTPLYLPDFSPTKPGYNDGGPGYRILYVGPEPEISFSRDAITRFLGVMEWESNADRTNAVAAALTVLLRNHFPGGKPIVCVTATKSHAGKDTVIAFATGDAVSVSISYQSTDWAMERSWVGAIKSCPDAAVIVVENARLDRRERFIASAFLERIATDPEPFLFSTGTGSPMRMRNDLVQAISTNFGTVSEDTSNRSLSIRLHPTGDVANRNSPIGNPRFEYLPANKERIGAELRGMVERWKAAGQPLDEDVRHPFTQWAKVIGGILKINAFSDFVSNYGVRKTSDDPIREALGLLGSQRFPKADSKDEGEWRRTGDWAEIVATLGLVRTLIPERDRENEASRTRAMGIVLSPRNGNLHGRGRIPPVDAAVGEVPASAEQ